MHTISYYTDTQHTQIVPGPCTQPSSSDCSQTVMSPIHWLETSPEWHGIFEGYQQNEVYFPELQPLERVYGQLVGKLAQQIHDVEESKRMCATRVIQHYLRKPRHGVRMGDMPEVPAGSKELCDYIAVRSNCLSPFLIQEVVKAIGGDELLDQWKDYERELAKCLGIPLYSGKRRTVPLIKANDLTSMSVEVSTNPEQLPISRVLALQKCFEKSVDVDVAIAQGYTSSSTVLYFAISKAAVPFIPSLLLSHVAQLRRLEVQKIAVFGYFAVNLEVAQAYALVSVTYICDRCVHGFTFPCTMLPIWQWAINRDFITHLYMYVVAMYDHQMPMTTAAGCHMGTWR